MNQNEQHTLFLGITLEVSAALSFKLNYQFCHGTENEICWMSYGIKWIKHFCNDRNYIDIIKKSVEYVRLQIRKFHRAQVDLFLLQVGSHIVTKKKQKKIMPLNKTLIVKCNSITLLPNVSRNIPITAYLHRCINTSNCNR